MSMNSTKPTKLNQIKRDWHMIDARNEILGRISTKIATLLMGKGKPYFVRNLDCGDYVVVVNSKDVRVTGKKEEQKVYSRHSGYPGGYKSETLRELRGRRPDMIIYNAVKGMLPDNRLKNDLLARLFIFSGTEHDYKDKFKFQSSNLEAKTEN